MQQILASPQPFNENRFYPKKATDETSEDWQINPFSDPRTIRHGWLCAEEWGSL